MKTDGIKELKKHISWAKNRNDWMGFGFAILESYTSEEAKQEFQKFRNSINYKRLLRNSLDYYRTLIKKWQHEIKSKGDKAFGNSLELEKEWYNDKVKILSLLEKEAKRLKIKKYGIRLANRK